MRAPREYPQLMTFEEKYGDQVYLVHSLEEVHRIAVAKVRERAALGYYYETVESLEAQREQAVDALIERSELSQDYAPRTLEALKDLKGTKEERTAQLLGLDLTVFWSLPEAMRKSAIEGFERFRVLLPRKLAAYDDEIEQAQLIEKLLTSERPEELTTDFHGRVQNAALAVLDSRDGGQYEGYSFSTPRSAPSTEELREARTR